LGGGANIYLNQVLDMENNALFAAFMENMFGGRFNIKQVSGSYSAI